MRVGPFWAAVGLLFVAELGDKTQLVAMTFGARFDVRHVIAAVVVADASSNLLSVAVGGVLGASLDDRVVGIAGGVAFLAFAIWTLIDDDDDRLAEWGGSDGHMPDPPPTAARTDDVRIEAKPGSWRDVRPRPAGGDSTSAKRRTPAVVASIAATLVIAELGDKSMLTSGTLAARGSPVLVWMGATVGMVAAGSLGVLAGNALGTRLDQRVMRLASAVVFAVFGVVLLVTSL